jgi:predicted ferric reductase
MQDPQITPPRSRLALLTTILIGLTPLLLWWWHVGWIGLWAAPEAGLIVLGKTCSLAGTAWYAWSLVLSARWRVMEGLVGPFDQALATHRLLGGLSFGLLVMHPVFLTLRVIALHSGVVGLWFNGQNWQVNLGTLALGLFMGLLLATVFSRTRHQLFMKLHRLFGLAFLVGAAHAWAVPGQIDQNPPLAWYMGALILLATTAYIYHTVFGSWLRRRYSYRVTGVYQPVPGVTEIVLEPVAQCMAFTAGQFGLLSLEDASQDNESHPYSFASHPHDRKLRFLVKSLGDDTSRLPSLGLGSLAWVEGPFGSFGSTSHQKRRQVWIAGGIGITPFLSMAASRDQRPGSPKVDLYYGFAKASGAVCIQELETTAASSHRLQFYPIDQSTQGLIDSELIRAHTPGMRQAEYFLCGPAPMMTAVMIQLKAAGVTDAQIHYESFQF